MNLRIDHVHAVATDLDASIAFYGKLGFNLLRRVEFGPEDDRKQLAYVGNQGTVIELVREKPVRSRSRSWNALMMRGSLQP